jgi:hypothetical protein
VAPLLPESTGNFEGIDDVAGIAGDRGRYANGPFAHRVFLGWLQRRDFNFVGPRAKFAALRERQACPSRKAKW